jgi:4-amino-4-deoxy-L-arabinose transferase-like glycosyltransferase
MDENSYVRHLAVVLVVAALVRIGFLLWSCSGWHFYFLQKGLTDVYFAEGYAIAAGYGYVWSDSPKGQALLKDLYQRATTDNTRALPQAAEPLSEGDLRPEMIHPLGMSLLVAAINRMFGIRADIPIQIVGIALDTAAAGIFWWIVTTFLSSPVGLTAGLLYALFPPLANAAIFKLPDGMLSFFLLACLACTLKATRELGWKALLWNVAAGVCIGLGGYLRPDYVLTPVILFFGLWAYTRYFWRSAVAIGVMQLTVLVLLLPWAYRNYSSCGRWIFTSTSVGATLITGLGEYHNPWGFGAADDDRDREAVTEGLTSAWDCEGDRYFQALFVDSVHQDPGAYILTVVRRLPFVLATPYNFGLENPWKTGIRFPDSRKAGEDRYLMVMRRPWYVLAAYWEYLAIGAFTLVGLLSTIVMALKEPSKAGLIMLIVSPHIYSISSHMLTHLEPRFLLPSMFGWLLGLGYLLSREVERFGPWLSRH